MGRKSKTSNNIFNYCFTLCKKLVKNFKKIPILLQLLILISILLLFFKKNNIETFENNNNTRGEVTFFHMTGCGHCNKMKNDWSNFEQNWSDNEIIINDKEQGQARDLCKKYNISGFPTIVFTINGEIPQQSQNQQHVYNGNRTASDLERWTKEMKETFL